MIHRTLDSIRTLFAPLALLTITSAALASAPTTLLEETLSARDGRWSSIPATGSPSPRREYIAAYDPARQQFVMFSGAQESGPLDRSVWTLSMTDAHPSWVAHSVHGGPNPRHGHIAVWDAPRDRLLMFGGYDDVDFAYMGDLWELKWSPTPTWTQLSPIGPGPSPRMTFGLIHDPVRDRLVLVGGHPTYLNDTWALPLSGPNAMKWSQLAPSNAPPEPRWGLSLVYDPDHDAAILFGGTRENYVASNDVWALRLSGGTSWHQLDPRGPDPAPRTLHTAIYDAAFKRMVIYGGAYYDPETFLGDTWELKLSGSKARWHPLRPKGTGPRTRDMITAIYDAPRHRLAFFGGFRGQPNAFFGDTWFLAWRDRGRRDDLEIADPGDETPVLRKTPVGLNSTETQRSLELVAVTPNPSFGDVQVTFRLPDRAQARLALLDVAGRVLASREVGSLGPGNHRVDLARGRSLPIGMYLIRLDAEGQTLWSKVAVVR